MTELKLKKLPLADQRFGNKTANLSLPMKKGFEVPQGFALSLIDSFPFGSELRAKLQDLIETHIDEGTVYVVRSSANIEDSSENKDTPEQQVEPVEPVDEA